MSAPDVFTVREAALRLHVSEYTIRKEIREGNLPTVPFTGSVVRIPRRALEEFVASAEKAS